MTITNETNQTPTAFSHYTVETGDIDKDRLAVLNKLYNPATKRFLLQRGLRSGKTAIEIGCGCGELACWLARQVGKTGHILAIDKDKKQLTVAKKLAVRHKLKNISFKEMCLSELPTLRESFDFAYTRWVLMYLTEPSEGIKAMHSVLNDGGTLVCEDVDFVNTSIFSFPKTDVIDRWINYWVKNFTALGLKKMDFFADIYGIMRELDFRNIKMTTNQPILFSEKEKSVLRCGMLRTKKSILENKIASEDEYNNFLKDARLFEESGGLIGFVRNILISGKKDIPNRKKCGYTNRKNSLKCYHHHKTLRDK